LIAILRRGLVVGGAGGGEPCLHMLASVHGRDPHCKLPPRTAEGARWKVGCTEGEEASVGVVGVQHAEKLEGRTPTHVKSELGCHSHRFLRRPRQSSRALVHCHQTPCCCQLRTLCHRTHTQCGRDMHHCQRVGVRSSQNHHQASLDAPLSCCNVYNARLPIHDGAGADVLVLVRGKHCQRWC
jgi:hypothetical protein